MAAQCGIFTGGYALEPPLSVLVTTGLNPLRTAGDVCRLAGWIVLYRGIVRHRSAATVSSASIGTLHLMSILRYHWDVGHHLGHVAAVLQGLTCSVKLLSIYNLAFMVAFLLLPFLVVLELSKLHTGFYEGDVSHSDRPGRVVAVPSPDHLSMPAGAMPALMAASLVLGAVFADSSGWKDVPEILWSTSRFMEVWALLPQLMLMRQTRGVQRYVGLFILLMAMYRMCYASGHVYRALVAGDSEFWHMRGRMLQLVSGGCQDIAFISALLYAWYRRFKSHTWVGDHIHVVVDTMPAGVRATHQQDHTE